MTFAHIAGLPIEQSLTMVAPAVGIFAAFVGVWLRRLAASLGRSAPERRSK